MIEVEKANHPVVWLCAKLKVSRASYYRWRNPKDPGPRAVRHDMLVEAIKSRYLAAGGKAGRDHLTLMCNNYGIKVSVSTVGLIMRSEQLRAIRTQAWRRTTEADPGARTAHIDNHMLDDDGNRDFTSSVPGTRLCGDITYLRTGQGWLFLATVIDLCTGMIIGWSMAKQMKARLCIDALAMARDHGYLHHSGVVFHSDRASNTPSASSRPGARATGSPSRWAKSACAGTTQSPRTFSRISKQSSTTTTATRPGSQLGPRSWNTSSPGTTANDPTAEQEDYHQQQH